MKKNIAINEDLVSKKIYTIVRNNLILPVILDKDLADYYQTSTSYINKIAKRNPIKFDEQTFKLTKEEWLFILETRNEREEDSIKFKEGHLPFVFTEEGSLALSTVLESQVAIQVFKVLLKSFFAMRNHQNIVINQLTYNGSFQLGSNNSMVVKINDFEDIVQLLTEIRRYPIIKDNPEAKAVIDKSIQLALKADKKLQRQKVTENHIKKIEQAVIDLQRQKVTENSEILKKTLIISIT